MKNKLQFPLVTSLLALLSPSVFSQMNDNFADATVISPTTLPITIIGEDNTSATLEDDEPEHGEFLSFNQTSNSLWYSLTPAMTSFVTITVAPQPTNQETDNVISIYTGSSLADLKLISERDAEFENGQESVTVLLTGGTEYFIATDAVISRNKGAGTYDITFTDNVTVPANDDIANAQDLGSSPIEVSGTTIGASTEATDPADTTGIGNTTSQTVWYTWTPPSEGNYNIIAETSAATPFTVSVMTGTPGGLSVVAAKGDENELGAVDLRFFAVLATTYYIAVDGFSNGTLQFSDEFDLEICVSPANDDFSAANNLGSSPTLTIDDDSSCAVSEEDEPDHGGSFFENSASASLWYAWQAPYTGRWEVSLTNENFDYLIAIYEGSSLDSLVEIIARDEFEVSTGGDSLILMATAGTTYYIAVDSFYQGDVFTLNLTNLDPIPAPEIEEFSSDPSTGEFSIEFTSYSSQTYSLTSSPDLSDWSNVIEATIPASTTGITTVFPFSDPGAVDAEKRFYRITRN